MERGDIGMRSQLLRSPHYDRHPRNIPDPLRPHTCMEYARTCTSVERPFAYFSISIMILYFSIEMPRLGPTSLAMAATLRLIGDNECHDSAVYGLVNRIDEFD